MDEMADNRTKRLKQLLEQIESASKDVKYAGEEYLRNPQLTDRWRELNRSSQELRSYNLALTDLTRNGQNTNRARGR